MVRQAAGGGLVMAATTLVKFGLYALALSAFWAASWPVNYAISFIADPVCCIFTVATKQPAMTAPPWRPSSRAGRRRGRAGLRGQGHATGALAGGGGAGQRAGWCFRRRWR